MGKLFCAPCLLFHEGTVTNGNQFIMGFDDWKNATKRLVQHENSVNHKDCVIKLNQRAQKQEEKEKNYWKEVLRRVVAVIKALASRGLAFREQTNDSGIQTTAIIL